MRHNTLSHLQNRSQGPCQMWRHCYRSDALCLMHLGPMLPDQDTCCHATQQACDDVPDTLSCTGHAGCLSLSCAQVVIQQQLHWVWCVNNQPDCKVLCSCQACEPHGQLAALVSNRFRRCLQVAIAEAVLSMPRTGYPAPGILHSQAQNILSALAAQCWEYKQLRDT